MNEDKLYAFIMRGELTKSALEKTETVSKYSMSEVLAHEYIDSLSLDLLDEELVNSARAMATVYTAIAAFENSVRRFVVKILIETKGENWWADCVSEKIRRNAESRKREEEKIRWHTPRGDSMINYTEFGDLVSIMSQNLDLFEAYIVSIDWARQIIQTIERSRNVIMHGETVLKYISFVGLREFPAAMLANAVYKSNSFENICDLVGIESIGGPVEFVLKRPTWSKSAPITNDSFWNAQGTVAAVLSQLAEMGVLNISNKDSATITVDNIANVRIDSENCFDLFAKLELLLQADILKEIRFNVIKDDVSMQLEMLSEGEKQLAQLLCLLEATKEYRALFLLDEFDSFLHPNWQRRFAEIISEIEITGQVIFTTHSPLTLGKMRKENIRILKDGQVFEPSADTFNRDITEVLEEIMDVGKRPVDVEKAMRDFRNSVIHGNKKDALIHENTLRELLSRDDPFWVTAGHLLSRMGD